MITMKSQNNRLQWLDVRIVRHTFDSIMNIKTLRHSFEMGWHIHAYYDIDQNEFDIFLAKHGLCRDDEDKIAQSYKQMHSLSDDVYLIYFWNNECQMHELYESYGVNFIRDDDRLCNPRFHEQYEKNTGKPFPNCLKSICWNLHTRADAIEIAHEIQSCLLDDIRLKFFAEWLSRTTQFCSTYDISF